LWYNYCMDEIIRKIADSIQVHRDYINKSYMHNYKYTHTAMVYKLGTMYTRDVYYEPLERIQAYS
jgi:hypothetical protein